jgi:hypothetical protein
MTRPHIKFFAAIVLVAALAAPALAQPRPKNHDPGRSEEAKQNDAAFDKQFRADQNGSQASAKTDPWGGVRSDTAKPAEAAKKPKK